MRLKLLFAFLIFQVSFAQHRTCGSDQIMQQIMSNPVQKQAYLEQQSKFDIEMQKLTTNKSAANSNVILQ